METIPFRIAQPDGTYEFSDALHLPDNHGLTADEIEAMKQARYDNWYAVVTAPPQEPAAQEDPVPPEEPAPQEE